MGGCQRWLWVIAGCVGLVSGCGRERTKRTHEAVGAAVAAAFGAPLESAWCEAGDTPSCLIRLAETPAFVVDVLGRDGDGWSWKARGARNVERVIRAGVAAELGVAVRDAACPTHECVSAGFECQVTLMDGVVVPVLIEADTGAESFVWRTRGVLAMEALVAIVRARLEERGADAVIDCGPKVRVAPPGTRFSCAVRLPDSTRMLAWVRVRNWKGRVEVTIGDDGGDGDGSDGGDGDGSGGDGDDSDEDGDGKSDGGDGDDDAHDSAPAAAPSGGAAG